MTTTGEHSSDPPNTPSLLLRRLSGAAATPAEALLSPLVRSRGDSAETQGQGAIYALVDVGSPSEEPIAAAFVTAGADGVGHVAISVSPAYRGRGIGGRILDDVLDVLRSEGVARVDTDVGGDPAATRLYSGAGFRPVEGLAGWLALDL